MAQMASANAGKHILVVDDNVATLSLLKKLFQEHSVIVTTAQNVSEACAFLSGGQEKFDLVLSDISMPGETGFDLLRWIKSQPLLDPDMPVILMTSQLPEAEHRILGLQLGAVDYVVRPIELQELVLRVMHAMEQFGKVRSLESQLKDSEGLAQLGRVLAANNHEMRNLASVMVAGMRILKSIIDAMPIPPTDLNKLFTALSSNADMLVDVTRLGRMFVDGSDVQLQSVTVKEVVDDVLQLLTPKLKGTFVANRIKGEQADIRILCQPTLLKQILINFVLNALDAIADENPAAGGSLSVSVRVDDVGRVILTVTDNGIGFAEKGTRTEFEAFKSTKKLRGGQGLGLWFSQKVARSMQSYISLTSQGPSQGASARISLLCDKIRKI